MRERQQKAAEPADCCTQRLHRMGDVGLVPGWDQRKVDIAGSHEADGIAFEWPRASSPAASSATLSPTKTRAGWALVSDRAMGAVVIDVPFVLINGVPLRTAWTK